MNKIMDRLLKRFKAISDPNRLRILMMLEAKPLCVCEITFVLNLAISTVSKHLSILKDAGFIHDKKDGKWVNYELQQGHNTMEDDLMEFIRKWMPDDEILRIDRNQIEKADRNQLCR